MRFLITGSEGFIGSHLSRELRNVGHAVFGMDIKVGVGNDAASPRNLDAKIAEARPDAIIHLAAQVGRQFGEDDVMRSVRDNAGMTAVVSYACGQNGIRMIYASTSEVYGDNGNSTCDEYEGPWSRPHNIYGLSKLWGEDVCKLYAPDEFTPLRFSMPYGPGLPAGRGRAAIINMLWQAKNGQTIPVHRGAERSWCWIGDTVRGARLAIENSDGPFNIGRDDNPVPMEIVAQMACDLTGASDRLIKLIDPPSRQTVVKRLATKRVRRLGWEPQVSLKEGMRRVLEEWVVHLDDDGNYVPPKAAEKVNA